LNDPSQRKYAIVDTMSAPDNSIMDNDYFLDNSKRSVHSLFMEDGMHLASIGAT